MNKRPVVAVIMGSDSDLPVMKGAIDSLDSFGIPNIVKILSAHRSPEEVAKFAKGAKQKGIKIIIAGAGGAAHLAGVLASLTTIPIIGVPMETKSLKGIDSLFSIVQMPSGVPVATVSIGASGAKNAGILAAQILATADPELGKALETFKQDMSRQVEEKAKKIENL